MYFFSRTWHYKVGFFFFNLYTSDKEPTTLVLPWGIRSVFSGPRPPRRRRGHQSMATWMSKSRALPPPAWRPCRVLPSPGYSKSVDCKFSSPRQPLQAIVANIRHEDGIRGSILFKLPCRSRWVCVYARQEKMRTPVGLREQTGLQSAGVGGTQIFLSYLKFGWHVKSVLRIVSSRLTVQ